MLLINLIRNSVWTEKEICLDESENYLEKFENYFFGSSVLFTLLLTLDNVSSIFSVGFSDVEFFLFGVDSVSVNGSIVDDNSLIAVTIELVGIGDIANDPNVVVSFCIFSNT